MDPAITARQTLDLLLPEWQALLQDWAASGELVAAAREALQLPETPAALSELVEQWAAGVFEALPPIVLLPTSSMPGAAGAYAISTGTIYVNADWLVQASAEKAFAVLTEELGHHLDGFLNVQDTLGDEGIIFTSYLATQGLGRTFSNIGKSTLDDKGFIIERLGEIPVERSGLNTMWKWVNRAGGTYWDSLSHLSLAEDGSIYLLGTVSGDGLIDFGEEEFIGKGKYISQGFISRLSPYGSFDWTEISDKTATTFKIRNDSTIALVDDNGILFRSASGPIKELSVSSGDISSIDELSDGTIVFTGLFDGKCRIGVADEFGNIGWLNSEYEFENTSSEGLKILALEDDSFVVLGLQEDSGVFVSKYNSNGKHEWTSTVDLAPQYKNYDLIDGKDGGLILVGHMSSEAFFMDSNSATKVTSTGLTNAFVARIDQAGAFDWIKHSDNDPNSYSWSYAHATSAALLQEGHILVGGNFIKTVLFDNLRLRSINDSWDGFLGVLNYNGEYEWVASIGGGLVDGIVEVASSSAGDIIVGGIFSGGTNLGLYAGPAVDRAADRDVFVGSIDLDYFTPPPRLPI